MDRRPLTKTQKLVLTAAFLPMLATGIAGGFGTYTNISGAYGTGTALGAVAAGEGATAVQALVLLGLTMLGQSSPLVIRVGLWALPMAASVMAAMAATDPGSTIIYAVTPMGMCVSAEGMAFLARRIVVHQDGRDAEAEARTAAVVQALAYHQARAGNHPDAGVRKRSERKSWRLARHVGVGDGQLGTALVQVQRERLTQGADAALVGMFKVPNTTDMYTMSATKTPALTAGVDTQQVPARHPTEVPPGAVSEGPAPVVGSEATDEGRGGHPTAPKLHVICGAGRHHTLTVPPRPTAVEAPRTEPEQVPGADGGRLPAEQARLVIETCWTKGTPPTETARLATRSVSYVKRVFRALDDDRGPAPVAGQLTLVKQEATA